MNCGALSAFQCSRSFMSKRKLSKLWCFVSNGVILHARSYWQQDVIVTVVRPPEIAGCQGPQPVSLLPVSLLTQPISTKLQVNFKSKIHSKFKQIQIQNSSKFKFKLILKVSTSNSNSHSNSYSNANSNSYLFFHVIVDLMLWVSELNFLIACWALMMLKEARLVWCHERGAFVNVS